MVGHLAHQLLVQGGVERRLDKRECAVLDRYHLAAPAIAGADHQLDRHRVEHFIGQHHAAEVFWHGVLPAHLRQISQVGLLARTQLARQFDDGVRVDGDALARQRSQHVARQAAGAGAELDDVGRALGDNSGCHARHACPEQRRHLGRGDEIALGAELGGAAAVIPEARRIQRQFHEPRKRDLPTGLFDLVSDALLQGVGRGQGVVVGGGQGHAAL